MTGARRKNVRAYVGLPPGAAAMVDDLVGSIYGESRSEVLRFMVQSWFTKANMDAADHYRRQRAEFDAARKAQEDHAHRSSAVVGALAKAPGARRRITGLVK